jgi:hypothetical protein
MPISVKATLKKRQRKGLGKYGKAEPDLVIRMLKKVIAKRPKTVTHHPVQNPHHQPIDCNTMHTSPRSDIPIGYACASRFTVRGGAAYR